MSMALMVKAMSIKVGNPLRKLVLIKLADNASDNGECWPSYQHIAEQCEISRRSVINHVDALIAAKLVTKEGRVGPDGKRSNVYFLNLDAEFVPANKTTKCAGAALGVVQELHKGGAGAALGGGAGDAHRISHSFEPVIEPKDSSSEPACAGSDQQSLTTDETQTTQANHSLHNQQGQGDNETTPTAKKPKAAKAAKEPKEPATDCPHKKILALWNEIMPELTQPRIWTDARATSLASRWKSKDFKADSLEFWEKLFRYIRQSDFLMGRTQSPGRRPMALTLDWVCKAENFAKIIEGRYENAG